MSQDAAEPATLIPLGSTRWSLWPETALRGAGFPAALATRLSDPELAAAADRFDERAPDTRPEYDEAWAAAIGRLSAAVRDIAAQPTFREAITWQNPDVVRNCLDKVIAGGRHGAEDRKRELKIASYVQRYSLKNDTIGFFGPVGWARIAPTDGGIEQDHGPDLLSRRSTYFENWALDALAGTISARPEVWPWLRPTVAPSASVTGSVLRLPFGKPIRLSALDVRILRQCDGGRTVRDVTGDPPDPATTAALLRLRAAGALRIDLGGQLSIRPEQQLAARIGGIGDAGVRERAMAPLDALIAARDAVGAAAGDPDRLLAAGRGLAETFEQLTGASATRNHGAAYAARTLIFEDTSRSAEVRVGRTAIESLAAPLGLVLDSAAWLANTVAERFEQQALALFDRETARLGGEELPLLHVLTSVMPEIAAAAYGDPRSEIIDGAVAEFQQRWRQVTGLPPEDPAGPHHVHLRAADLADEAARVFATGEPRWSNAHWHSPDLMLATADEQSLAAGDVDFVLGELHCASNTLETQCFVDQHPNAERLRAAAVASGLDRRVIIIPRQDSPLAAARLTRAPEVTLPSYTYVAIGSESFTPPPAAAFVSAADLLVRRKGDELIVCHRTGRGGEHAFTEMAGEPLTALVVNAFQPFALMRHRPRISVDRLVVAREAWRFPAADLTWARGKDEQRRFAQIRRWRAEQGLPELAFIRVPVEGKPLAVDFRSLPLVNLLASAVRRTAAAGDGYGTLTVTEMLPGPDQLWLRDAHGAHYTAELRMVAVAQR